MKVDIEIQKPIYFFFYFQIFVKRIIGQLSKLTAILYISAHEYGELQKWPSILKET